MNRGMGISRPPIRFLPIIGSSGRDSCPRDSFPSHCSTKRVRRVRCGELGHPWPNRIVRTVSFSPASSSLRLYSGCAFASRPDETVIGKNRIGGREIPIPRFMSAPPSTNVTGDIDSMALFAGQAVGLVNELKTAGALVRELADGASRLIEQRLSSLVSGV